MSAHEPERGAALAAAILLVIVLVAGIVLIQFLVDQPYRQAAIRLVAASVLLVAVFRVRAFVRASTERPPAWDAERAGEARWARLDRPPGRRFGRGPSLEALRVLIASLERRR